MALAEFTSAGSRDFRQRYLGVYGWYTNGQKEVLVYVSHVDERYTRFTDSKGIVYTANADTGATFKFIPVTRKLFTYKGELYHIKRRPARQYQRGIAEGNTLIRNLTYNYEATLSFELLQAYLSGGDVISPYLAVSRDSVFLYDQVIGLVLGTELILDNDMYLQEVTDAVKRSGLKYKVTLS